MEFEMIPARAVEAASKSSSAQATPVVFVVDDDVSVRESLEAMIRFAGLRNLNKMNKGAVYSR
ncbi:hypothetical protein [Paraburkholderia youngii]|uniref:hypothetical protein n=1 Tax=Paraburkholderia youngii TaxID=2782701 RepID=UPI001FE2BF84|nr:hypothetical protein [Paraburkholderia youngii]